MVRPFAFRINAPPEGAKTVDIRMHVMATWEVDGLGVAMLQDEAVQAGRHAANLVFHRPAAFPEHHHPFVFRFRANGPNGGPGEGND